MENKQIISTILNAELRKTAQDLGISSDVKVFENILQADNISDSDNIIYVVISYRQGSIFIGWESAPITLTFYGYSANAERINNAILLANTFATNFVFADPLANPDSSVLVQQSYASPLIQNSSIQFKGGIGSLVSVDGIFALAKDCGNIKSIVFGSETIQKISANISYSAIPDTQGKDGNGIVETMVKNSTVTINFTLTDNVSSNFCNILADLSLDSTSQNVNQNFNLTITLKRNPNLTTTHIYKLMSATLTSNAGEIGIWAVSLAR